MNMQLFRFIPMPILAALLLAGCGTTDEITRPSTYVGDITSAHLKDVYLAAPDGKRAHRGQLDHRCDRFS